MSHKNLKKYINRLSFTIDRAQLACKKKNKEDKIKFTMSKIINLTEIICYALLKNEPVENKARQLCTEHLYRGNLGLNESHNYIKS